MVTTVYTKMSRIVNVLIIIVVVALLYKLITGGRSDVEVEYEPVE